MSLHPRFNLWSRSRLLPSTSTKVASHLVSCDLQSRLWMLLYSGLPIAELNPGLPIANYLELRSRHVEQRSTWNRGARGTREPREIWRHEDYKVKPKRNHCHGHTPQAQKGPYPRIQKGAKTPNSGVERNTIRYTCQSASYMSALLASLSASSSPLTPAWPV